MKDRYGKLLACNESVDEGTRLMNYYNEMYVIHEHRNGQADPGMSLATLRQRFTTIVKWLGNLPASLAQRLLCLELRAHQASEHWEAVVTDVNPFPKPGVFDLERPTMASLPRVQAWKLLSFRVTFFRECLVTLLLQGETKVNSIRALLPVILEALDQVDVLEIDHVSATHLHEAQIALKSLYTIAFMPLSGKFLEELKEMEAVSTSKIPMKKENAIHIIKKAVASTPYYDGRRKHMLDAEATFKSRSAQASTLRTTLDKLKIRCGEEDVDHAVDTLCADLDIVSQHLPVEAVSSYVDEVRHAVLGHFRAVLQSSEIPPSRVQVIQNSCQKATMVFPMSTEFVPISMEFASRRAKLTESTRVTELRTVVGKVLAFSGSAVFENIGDVVKFTSAVSDTLRLPETRPIICDENDLQPWLKDAILAVQKALAEGNHKEHIDGLLDLFEKVASVMNDESFKLLCCTFGHLRKLEDFAEKVDRALLSKTLLTDHDTATFGKLVVDLAHSVDKVGDKKDWTTPMHDCFRGVANTWKKSHQYLNDLAVSLSTFAMEGTVQKLLLHLRSTENTAWERALQVVDSDYNALRADAEGSLMKMELDALKDVVVELKANIEKSTLARNIAGHALQADVHDEQRRLYRVAIVRCVESELFTTLGKTETPLPTMRADIVKSIRKLRDENMQEKKILHDSMYRAAYKILLPKK